MSSITGGVTNKKEVEQMHLFYWFQRGQRYGYVAQWHVYLVSVPVCYSELCMSGTACQPTQKWDFCKDVKFQYIDRCCLLIIE